MHTLTVDNLQAAYLDYLNNFITYGGWAAYHELPLDQATIILDAGRQMHEALATAQRAASY